MSTPDRLADNKAAVSEALASCVSTALKIPELVAKDQGTALTELTDGLVSRESLIASTCGVVEQQLGRAVGAYTVSLEAAAAPLHRLLASAGRLEAVLAVEEAQAAKHRRGDDSRSGHTT
ncbi:hypothetical protein PLESTB_001666100 [Pleodorina starrii]|uniref:Uncharacterized protein n=1 Tax=Pleodorina starrii TaxID=330485 RepID=A0A9W6BYR7_9CHLO|nr:hypothetical protein PLESTB_001666100 [Pleodorina starrii]GLC75461.1 hypothetical protein PLESTF_001640300 [Pleodorina starrii]